MIEKIYRFTCNDCKKVSEFPLKPAAQKIGWAIANGGKKCYCPACAIFHRNTGCKGVQNSTTKQIKLEV